MQLEISMPLVYTRGLGYIKLDRLLRGCDLSGLMLLLLLLSKVFFFLAFSL